jgi:hypothetical protein
MKILEVEDENANLITENLRLKEKVDKLKTKVRNNRTEVSNPIHGEDMLYPIIDRDHNRLSRSILKY